MSTDSAHRRRGLAVAALIPALAMAGCTTTSGGLSGGWQIDSVASRCVASIVGGAIVGGLLGAARGGGRNIGAGAAIGAGAGGALCVVMAALDQQDKERIKQAQLAAARTGSAQNLSYTGMDGLQRQVTVRPSAATTRQGTTLVSATTLPAAASPGAGQQICRSVETSATVASKGSAEVPAQIVCRNANGEWGPA